VQDRFAALQYAVVAVLLCKQASSLSYALVTRTAIPACRALQLPAQACGVAET